jgi:hypothetical protein
MEDFAMKKSKFTEEQIAFALRLAVPILVNFSLFSIPVLAFSRITHKIPRKYLVRNTVKCLYGFARQYCNYSLFTIA